MGDINYDEAKFAELVVYIADRCKSHTFFGATKLNKILFYSDFVAFEKLGSPITGAEYQALDRGPAPVRLLPVRKQLKAQESIALESFGRQERITPLREPDLGRFTAEEISIVDSFIDRFKGLSAEEVSEESHAFLGWKAAFAEGPKTRIPYETALVSNRPIDEFETTILVGEARGYGYI